MSVRRLSNSTISTQGRGKSSTFIAGYSPAIDEMDLIERVVVGSGGTSSITFSNIPQTYQHLQLRVLAGDSSTGVNWSWASITLNGSASNYSWHTLYGTGSIAGEEGAPSVSIGRFYIGISTHFGAAVMDLLDYTSTSKNKTVRQIAGVDVNGGGIITIGSSLWYSSPAAITSITIAGGSGNFRQHSTFSLYGVIA